MTMDALTWFKSVFRRELTTPDALRADVATEMWADVPLHLAAARLRPAPPSADDDEDWDAVIARAKMQAATAKAPRLPPPSPRAVSPEMQETPPPLAAPQIPVRARMDALWSGLKKPPAQPLAFTARRPAIEDMITPPPLEKTRRAAGPSFGPAKRPARG
jgi:hypothetical protein